MSGIACLSDDTLLLVLTFLPPHSLCCCDHVSRSFYRVINSPSTTLSYAWRSLAARLWRRQRRLPAEPQPSDPLVLSPFLPSCLNYRDLLAFTTPWPAAWTSLPMVTARGHQHEMRLERDWDQDEIRAEYEKIIRAVQLSKKEEEEEGKEREQAAAAAAETAEMKEEEDAGEGDDEQDEEGDDDDDDDDESDDNDDDDVDDDEEQEEDEEDDEEGGHLAGAAAAEDADEDDEDEPSHAQPTPAPALLRDAEQAAAEHELEGDVFVPSRAAVQALLRALNDASNADDPRPRALVALLMAEDRREQLRAHRDWREDRQRHQATLEDARQRVMRRAWMDVGGCMESEAEARATRSRQGRLRLQRERRWRRGLELTGRGRRLQQQVNAQQEQEAREAGDEDEEKLVEEAEEERDGSLCSRVRYSGNTQGDDRAIILNLPFPFRLPHHNVPFTVLEVMSRERLVAHMQESDERQRRREEWERTKQQQAQAREKEEVGAKRRNRARSGSKEESEREEKKQRSSSSSDGAASQPTASSSLTSTAASSSSHPSRQRSLTVQSAYYAVCRLSLIAYFEVAIEHEDAAETLRREREAREEEEKRRRERRQARQQARQEAEAAGELLPDDDDDDDDDDGGRGVHPLHRLGTVSECVSIGLANSAFPLLFRQPGWDRNSFGYHGDDGAAFHGSGTGSAGYGPPFGAGDVVGCGLDYRSGQVFFTKNGRLIGTHPATVGLEDGLTGDWSGVLGLDSAHVVRLSICGPFVFDIERYEWETEGEAEGEDGLQRKAALHRMWTEQMKKRAM